MTQVRGQYRELGGRKLREGPVFGAGLDDVVGWLARHPLRPASTYCGATWGHLKLLEGVGVGAMARDVERRFLVRS